MEWIAEDELVELTPSAIRMRKAILDPDKRKRAKKALPVMTPGLRAMQLPPTG